MTCHSQLEWGNWIRYRIGTIQKRYSQKVHIEKSTNGVMEDFNNKNLFLGHFRERVGRGLTGCTNPYEAVLYCLML